MCRECGIKMSFGLLYPLESLVQARPGALLKNPPAKSSCEVQGLKGGTS